MQNLENLKGVQKQVAKRKVASQIDMKTKPQGKGIVKALGQKSTTGNFAKIKAEKGIGAAIGALQNKLSKRRGLPIPYTNKKK